MLYYLCLTPNPFHELLTYASDEIIALGTQVLLPYGQKEVYGIIWEVSHTPNVAQEKIKKIHAVCSDVLLPEDYLKWLAWVSGYYHVPLAMFAVQTLPPFLWQALPVLPPNYLDYYTDKSYLHARVPAGILVQDKQWTLASLKKRPRGVSEQPSFLPSPYQLTATQHMAIVSIDMHAFKSYLLEGPTGSGKTEVYLDCLCQLGRTQPVLLMMPEITLTRSMLARLTARLGAPPWVYHSQMSKSARIHHWQAASKNAPGIWIGTRSAAFLPCKWAMIVIDEEHDASYAQSQKMYYSTKHIMLMRAKLLEIPLILGSATPALDTLYLAQKKTYAHLLLEKSYHAPVRCHVLDARKENMSQGLLRPIWQALDAQLAKGHQVLLFLNRRGYAPILFCKTCSWKSSCRNCDVSMVVHAKQRQLRCHYCEYRTSIPKLCPEGHESLVEVGIGTQRLEASLRAAYPDIPMVRIDQDSTLEERNALEVLLATETPAIILGTQMITKGLDAAYIRMVVIVQLDSQLLRAEYKADERAYQLVTQVMGRAARRVRGPEEEPDTLWVQTFFPEHPLWRAVKNDQLAQYPAVLLEWRRKQNLPPFSYVCLVRLEHTKEIVLQEITQKLKLDYAQSLSHPGAAQLYGPFPSWMRRRKNHFHYLGMLVALRRTELDQAMQCLYALLKVTKVRWSLERDAQDSSM